MGLILSMLYLLRQQDMPDTPSSVGREWLCLLFFLPSKRAHARVQAWRRLQRAGAVLLKNSAYVLPASAESREDLEWIKQEIVTSGGEAMVLAMRAPDAPTEDEIVAAFRAARGRDFKALAEDAAGLVRVARRRSGASAGRQFTQRLRRLRERFEEKAAIDFVDAPGREEVAALLEQLDELTGRSRTMRARTATAANAADYRDNVWVTRPQPGVDRMSSAWLIRRFVDANARFVFGSPAATPKAIPFDTFEAEFGHHGAHCTFETFCARFAITDPAVRHIGRIVHDLDLKESKYHETETATIGRLVEGLRRTQHDDDALLQSGIDMFEALYQSLATVEPSHSAGKPRGRARRSSVRSTRKRS
jgi:hypothetical protein